MVFRRSRSSEISRASTVAATMRRAQTAPDAALESLQAETPRLVQSPKWAWGDTAPSQRHFSRPVAASRAITFPRGVLK